jgi:hypothetical protein
MRKLTLCGIGNTGNYNHIIVRYRPNFFIWLDTIVSAAGFPTDSDMRYYHGITGRQRIFTDRHMSYYDEGAKDGIKMDLFFGKKKVFIVLLCNQEKRHMFTKSLMQHTISARPKRISHQKKK